MDYLNTQKRYRCLYVNVEVGQSAREAVGEAMRAILSELAFWAGTVLNDSFVDDLWAEVLAKSGPHSALGQVLNRWSARDP